MLRNIVASLKITKNLASRVAIKPAPFVVKRCYGIYEPDYLDKLRPSVPIYDTLNIQITGYDYPILENFQKFIHDTCTTMDVNMVEDSWALPPKHEKITKLKPGTAIVDANYELKTYKRVVQIVDVKAHLLPVLLRLIEAGMPEGVSLNVQEHTDLMDTERYVPDKELLDLKDQLTEMGGPSTKKK